MSSPPLAFVTFGKGKRDSERSIPYRQRCDHDHMTHSCWGCVLRPSLGGALRVKRLDLIRGLIDVVEALPDYATEPDTPKSHKSRTVPIPRSVISDLAALVAMRGPEELVFMNSTGGVLDNTNTSSLHPYAPLDPNRSRLTICVTPLRASQ
jgi:integrase